ncbi:GTPase Era [Curvivirga aplysinae]|uniref:GTPase Era n=1 Tax=Curvivirga aplysinae TaxID=2529852 RepID=UPI0012BC401B|nr:GTPase Era [Curvivirga aplysinae]MTI09013.1 GTPase Era [Curvivirga aplysinae]
MPENSRAGFVALIGAPNAGKSTLLNRFVGTKVSIVTHKVQTTRSRVLGVVIEDDAQIVFVDTPGIFAPKRRLDRAMVRAAWDGAKDADVVVLMVDAMVGLKDEVKAIIQNLQENNRKAVLALNKIDKVKREELLTLTAELDDSGVFTDIFMISALNGDGASDLLKFLCEKIPQSPWLFPEDQITDMPLRMMAAEVTREKLFINVHQELPYELAVETETWEEFKNGSVKIEQTVYVRRESQRSIILGKDGQRIKKIGADAREELTEMFGRKVHLFLYVKVRERWEENSNFYMQWGLEFNA